ncbi:MAG TPA: (5-formylfuran-3-yl)methyl phosphate synthase, partial [Isosphaeraceae bacterium]
MAGLLVSVRSADEARAALAGGAMVIDVKEPGRGALGRADVAVWDAVRRAVPPEVPVSVALGELREWRGVAAPDPGAFEGIAYRKLGLAGSGAGWADEWAGLLRSWGIGPPWVAVAYADWDAAGAPPPGDVLEVATALGCAGLLVDTWDKSRPGSLDLSWLALVRRAQAAGRFVALAGGLDAGAIARLAPLCPELFAVRGAACGRGERRGTIEAPRVARLVRAARGGATIEAGSRGDPAP